MKNLIAKRAEPIKLARLDPEVGDVIEYDEVEYMITDIGRCEISGQPAYSIRLLDEDEDEIFYLVREEFTFPTN